MNHNVICYVRFLFDFAHVGCSCRCHGDIEDRWYYEGG